jgi:hypothetical protein
MPNKDFNDWNVLQEGKVWVGYFEDDFPWCKAKINIPYSLEDILPVIENVDDYHKILDSVIYSSKDKNDIAHIRINYPYPLTDREYIVKFKRIIDKNDIVYAFTTSDSLNKNINTDFIRLINAQGEWRLSPLNKNLTEVSYVWNGELRGSIPSWALSRAWVKHGSEVLNNLEATLKELNEN